MWFIGWDNHLLACNPEQGLSYLILFPYPKMELTIVPPHRDIASVKQDNSYKVQSRAPVRHIISTE